MTRPLRIQYPGAFYHVFSRGNERKNIFIVDDDRELFLAVLDESCHRFDVSTHSFCLMDNHIHLLIETKKANLSNFMKYLLGVYTIRFNRIHKRTGHLFQGRYKAYLVERDAYLLELSRYIHLNPVKAGMIEYPEDYPWSSMRHFLQKEAPSYLERTFLLSLFDSPQSYRQFILKGADGRRDPFKGLIGGLVLGSREFAAQFMDQATREEGISGKRDFLEKPLDAIIEMTEFDDRDLQIYSLWKFGKRTLKEVGGLFSKTESAVSHAVKRTEQKIIKDQRVGFRIRELERAISSFKN